MEIKVQRLSLWMINTVFLLAKINFIQPFDFIDVRFYFGERFSLPFISKLQVYILLTSQYM
ncbi:hypothetical protein D9G85_15455 [Escherichia coli]|nr:hypothetical protein [Escherichia coli]MIC67246.1 hypothetical protein [Escherichia coli]